MTLPEHVRRNRAQWTRWAPEYAEWAPAAWGREDFTRGVWGLPERELGVFPESVAGLDAVEPEDDSADLEGTEALMSAT